MSFIISNCELKWRSLRSFSARFPSGSCESSFCGGRDQFRITYKAMFNSSVVQRWVFWLLQTTILNHRWALLCQMGSSRLCLSPRLSFQYNPAWSAPWSYYSDSVMPAYTHTLPKNGGCILPIIVHSVLSSGLLAMSRVTSQDPWPHVFPDLTELWVYISANEIRPQRCRECH